MIPTFIIENLAEVICGGTFLTGFSIYSYFKLKGKLNKHKLVYYDITDRIVRAKKIEQKISDKSGGSAKGDTFFKGAK